MGESSVFIDYILRISISIGLMIISPPLIVSIRDWSNDAPSSLILIEIQFSIYSNVLLNEESPNVRPYILLDKWMALSEMRAWYLPGSRSCAALHVVRTVILLVVFILIAIIQCGVCFVTTNETIACQP